MANEIQGFLQKKVGPLPMWGWLAGGGGLLGFLYMQRKGSSAGTAGQPGTAPDVPYVPSPIIVTPQTAAPSTSSINPNPSPSTGTGLAVGQQAQVHGGNGQPAMLIQPGQPYWKTAGQIPDGSIVTVTGPPVSAMWGTGVNPDGSWNSNPSPFLAVPIKYAGSDRYVNATGLSPMGMGGGSMLKLIPGSGGGKLNRFSGKHAHPQYLTTGMGGGGHTVLQQTSQRTGVPVGRLMALNPDHWQHPHRQRRANVIHIA